MLAPPSSGPLLLPDTRDVPGTGTAIDAFVGVRDAPGGYGARLRLGRERAGAFRREFAASGRPEFVGTYDLVSLPYPTRFGLWRASVSPAPFLTITNRMLVIRWADGAGATRTLLFEPSDVELDANTPYFRRLARRTPPGIRGLMLTRHATVTERLAWLGIPPGEVDYLAFDHLHTQDVRRWLGTTEPEPDISPDAPVPATFPNARLVVQRAELAAMADLHPLQRPWYQPETFRHLPVPALLPLDGDTYLGPGVAFLATPGHVYGNQTLLLNTDSGIWASSENAIAAECLTPEHSAIPGVARWTKTWGEEVVLNANTLETTAEQYNSMVIEKTLVDRAQTDSRFLQFFPSSELTRHWTSPGTSPTFVHGGIRHGRR